MQEKNEIADAVENAYANLGYKITPEKLETLQKYKNISEAVLYLFGDLIESTDHYFIFLEEAKSWLKKKG